MYSISDMEDLFIQLVQITLKNFESAQEWLIKSIDSKKVSTPFSFYDYILLILL